MPKYRFLTSAVGAFAALAVTAGEAHANARICQQLEREAHELRQGGLRAKRADLQRKLHRVEAQVRRAGCSGLRLIFGGAKKRECRALRADMRSLRGQLHDARSVPSSQRRLRFVEAEMRRYGCDQRTRQVQRGDRYQTLCVRKCDGYFFPIGFSTAKSDLKRDRAACESFYPQGSAELYLRASGAEQSEGIVSLDGEPYAEQPFAFAFRTAYQPACAATLSAGVRAIEKNMRQTVRIDPQAIVPLPVPRPHVPETVDTGRDERRVIARKHAPKRDIRVVGPAAPYIVARPADGAVGPLASAPERVWERDAVSWIDRISGLIAPAAQADETGE